MDRRGFLGGAAASVAALAAGRGATLVPTPTWASPAWQRQRLVVGPGTRPYPNKPEGIDTLPQIEHVVIYMQENHSFDNYFGMLGRGDGFTLDGQGKPTNSQPDSKGNQVVAYHSTDDYCQGTPFSGQSWNATHREYNGGAMDGFVTANGDDRPGSMAYWDGTDLPYYYALANEFVLCDRWFTSAPCQTLPNRRYLQAATSAGMITSDPHEVLAIPNVPNGCIWERFEAHGITWADYAVDLADILLFQDFYKSHAKKVKRFEDFLLAAQTGTLPQVSIISPGHHVYSEEDPSDIQLGEAYSASIINALMQGPAWEKTALFFMYDEHGGYYDHVPPPAAIAPDNIPPNTEPGDEPGGFDWYGFRVPALVISPFAKKDYVSHVVHDHTSVLKFLETKFNLGALTYRDANADDLLDCFDFAAMAFREPPELPAPGLRASGSTCSDVAAPKIRVDVPTSTTTTGATTTTSPSGGGAVPATPIDGQAAFTG